MPPEPRLSTYSRRRTRFASARDRRHRALVRTAVVVGALLLLAGGAAAVARSRLHRPPPATVAMRVPQAGVTTPAPSPDLARSQSASASPRGTHSRASTLSISAVGDMIFDRRVATLIAARGGRAPLTSVAARLAASNVTIGNLESPLSEKGGREASKSVTFLGDPRGVESLKAAGFDAVSLANNHVLDYGPSALLDTVSRLDAARIAHAGAGADLGEAWKPAIVRSKDATLAYLAFSYVVPPGFIARDDRPGMASGRSDKRRISSAIAAAKASGRLRHRLVSLGCRVHRRPHRRADRGRSCGRGRRRRHGARASSARDSAAGTLQGAAHRVLSGDFVFDHYSRKTGEAFILTANLGPDGVTDVLATPVYLDRNGAPEVVTGSSASVILARLKSISARRDTRLTIHDSLGRVAP